MELRKRIKLATAVINLYGLTFESYAVALQLMALGELEDTAPPEEFEKKRLEIVAFIKVGVEAVKGAPIDRDTFTAIQELGINNPIFFIEKLQEQIGKYYEIRKTEDNTSPESPK